MQSAVNSTYSGFSKIYLMIRVGKFAWKTGGESEKERENRKNERKRRGRQHMKDCFKNI